MRVRILIKTPKGNAADVEGKVRMAVMPFKKPGQFKSWTNPEQDTIFWEVEDDYKRISRLMRNVNRFDYLMRNIMSNKFVRKELEKNLKPEDKEHLQSMLTEQTSVEIIKEADAEELISANTPIWEKIREKFWKAKK